MKKKHHICISVRLHQALAIFSFLIFFCLSSLASQSITGCNKGMIYTDDKQYPQQSIGNVPDRIANYEMVFQKGKYAIRISSRFEFIPFIYKKIKGKYQWAGLPTRVSFQNDKSGNAFFYYDFYADHLTGISNNFWLLQIKPVPEAQNIPHLIRVITKVVACPGSTPPPPSKPPCPPGYTLNPNGGVFGQADCIPIK